MLQISNSIVSIKNMDQLLQLFVNSVVQVVHKADAASILIRNDEDLFEFKAAQGFELDHLSKIMLSMDEIFLDKKYYQKSVIIENPEKFDRNKLSPEHYIALKEIHALDIKSTICTPIIIDNRLYGLINVDSVHNEGIFNEEDIAIMEYLTGQLAVAIKNVLLFKRTLFLSQYDGLTKLYHRHYFDELYQNIYERAKRYNEKFCLCIMDLNNLKQINDIYGHLAGDMALKYFSKLLKKNIRGSDLLGRFGGDEFILVFLNGDQEMVEQKMQSISNVLSQTPLTYEDHSFYVHFSFGIASFPEDSSSKKELMKIADDRMYKNKIKNKTM